MYSLLILMVSSTLDTVSAIRELSSLSSAYHTRITIGMKKCGFLAEFPYFSDVAGSNSGWGAQMESQKCRHQRGYSRSKLPSFCKPPSPNINQLEKRIHI